jgi:hypothetical protein
MTRDTNDVVQPIVVMGSGTALTLGGHPLGPGLILLGLGMSLNQS